MSGLWHGANWTFVIWGALHGFYLVFGIITNKYRKKLKKFAHLDKLPFLSIIITFFLVSYAWIFFRANNVENAFYIAKNIFIGIPDIIQSVVSRQFHFEFIGLHKVELIICDLLIFFLEGVHVVQSRYSVPKILNSYPSAFRWAVYYSLAFSVLIFGVFENRQFIYFQF